MLETLAGRLRLIRESVGLSLRRTADLVEEQTGYSVSHDGVHQYEKGRTVPALYVRAFSDAFGCRVEWLLSGDGPPLDDAWTGVAEDGARPGWAEVGRSDPNLYRATMRERAEAARRAWERFIEDDHPGAPIPLRILDSWKRSREAGVERGGNGDGTVRPPRLPPERLEARRRTHRRILEAATPHLAWLSSLHRDLDHVVYLTCRDGIVLESRGSPEDLLEAWSLLPGHDWSEETMGTNGAGTALKAGKPTTVIGPEHYVEAFYGCTCVTAPVLGSDREIVGAIDLSTTLEDGDPRRLAVVAYAADNVSRALRAKGG